MNKGERKIVGNIHAKDYNYRPLVGYEVEIAKKHLPVKDTWYVYPINKNGTVNKNMWYIHERDLLDINNQQGLSKMKGEIEV